jgi:hypothetical protein
MDCGVFLQNGAGVAGLGGLAAMDAHAPLGASPTAGKDIGSPHASISRKLY